MRILTIALICFPVILNAQSFEELAHHFDYDSALPLDVQETNVSEHSGVQVHDIGYASPLGGRVPAYLVVPAREGHFAAILFGHWMMKGSPYRNRTEFLDEAVLLARAGAVSLLIDTPFVRPGFVEEKDLLASAQQAAEVSRQQIVDLRRGLDLLLARPDIDPKRIAYVGHSFDAHVGAILAGVDKRIQSFVLMSGAYSDEELFHSNQPDVKKYRKQLGDEKIRTFFREYGWDDPIHYVSHSSPAAVFLQFASSDQSRQVAKTYYDAFGDPKKIAIYDATHALDAAARHDRVDWLVRRLSLRPIDEAALMAIAPLK
ncbi:MAG: hypothetical protein ABSH09_27965 [Bryobacteraceae bacterium]|jgi:dienelactone hydrolase